MPGFARRLLTGTVQGLLATAVMSLTMAATRRVRALGEPPPRRITRRLTSAAGIDLGGEALDAAAVVAHFAFGATMGGVFAALPPRLRQAGAGALFGLAVWGLNYAGWLPKAGLMPRPANDRPGRPTSMVAAHVVFGTTLAMLDRAVARAIDGNLPQAPR